MTVDLKNRKCQDCNACCHLMGVPSLEKPYFTPCTFQKGRGCSIYSTRPQECQDFKCAWLQGAFRAGDRPDKSGIMVVVQTANFPTKDGKAIPIPIAKVYETTPDGINSERAIDITRRLMGAAVVMYMTPESRQVLGGPKPLVDAVEAGIRAVQMTQSTAVVSDEEAQAIAQRAHELRKARAIEAITQGEGE